MGWRHGLVVVAPDDGVRSTLTAWFEAAGYELQVTPSFSEAKALLNTGPDLLVSELKLGEFNGLHLAARAHLAGIPAIIRLRALYAGGQPHRAACDDRRNGKGSARADRCVSRAAARTAQRSRASAEGIARPFQVDWRRDSPTSAVIHNSEILQTSLDSCVTFPYGP